MCRLQHKGRVGYSQTFQSTGLCRVYMVYMWCVCIYVGFKPAIMKQQVSTNHDQLMSLCLCYLEPCLNVKDALWMRRKPGRYTRDAEEGVGWKQEVIE